MNEHIKALIRFKFGTSIKFAEALNESPASVSNRLMGRRKMDEADIEKWSLILGISDELRAFFFWS